jgi:hypothetical protein
MVAQKVGQQTQNVATGSTPSARSRALDRCRLGVLVAASTCWNGEWCPAECHSQQALIPKSSDRVEGHGHGGSDQARDLVLVRCAGGDVDGHGEPRVGGELRLDDVDVDDADVGVADGDLSSESLLDVVAAPPLAEPLAFFLEGFDQLREPFVAGVLGGSSAELAEKVAGALLPADGSACGGLKVPRTR